MRTPEERKIYNAKYMKENREKVLANQKTYREAHREEKKEWMQKYEEENREAIAVRKKKYHEDHPEVELRRCCKKVGITIEYYNSLPKECGACHTKDPGSRKGKSLKSWPLDHDHKPGGKFRGLLCSPCNLALGLLKDDPERCRALVTYLELNLFL